MKKNIQEELSRIKTMMGIYESIEDMVSEPDMESENMGMNDIDVKMAIFSHLSDLQELSPDMNAKINFIKVLVDKYISSDARVSTDKLDALYGQVQDGDFSGSALSEENNEMQSLPEQSQDVAPETHDSSDVMHKPGEYAKKTSKPRYEKKPEGMSTLDTTTKTSSDSTKAPAHPDKHIVKTTGVKPKSM